MKKKLLNQMDLYVKYAVLSSTLKCATAFQLKTRVKGKNILLIIGKISKTWN